MRKSSIVALIVAIIIIAGVAYALTRNKSTTPSNNNGSTNTSQNNSQQTSGTTGTTGQGGTATLALNTSSNSTLGTFLVGPNGMTLYTYSPDTPNTSTCYGACATNWPPYTVASSANLAGGTGITGNIATTTRTDGKMQITYNGKPLYYYIKDKQPGDTLGQNVGGIWFVVKP